MIVLNSLDFFFIFQLRSLGPGQGLLTLSPVCHISSWVLCGAFQMTWQLTNSSKLTQATVTLMSDTHLNQTNDHHTGTEEENPKDVFWECCHQGELWEAFMHNTVSSQSRTSSKRRMWSRPRQRSTSLFYCFLNGQSQRPSLKALWDQTQLNIRLSKIPT